MRTVLLAPIIIVTLLLSGFSMAHNASVIDDTTITMKIKAKMAEDNILSPLDIKVKTDKGVVFIMGNVKSSTEADRAIETAYSVNGVTDVDITELTVKG